jgi:hypothetical protein
VKGNWEELKEDIMDLYNHEKNDQQFQEEDLDAVKRHYNDREFKSIDTWKLYRRNMMVVGSWLYSKHKITEAKWHEVFWFLIPCAARKKLISILEHTVTANLSELWTPEEVDKAAKQL